MEWNQLWLALIGFFQTFFSDSQNPNSNPLISRQVIFGSPNFTSVQISPDGKWLSYLAPVNNVLNIWIRPLDNLNVAGRSLTSESGRGVQLYNWLFDNKHILFSHDLNGDENWKLYKVNVATGVKSVIVDNSGVQAVLVCSSYKAPNEILIGANDRDPRYHDLYSVNLETGVKMLVLNNTDGFGVSDFTCDQQLNVRLASKQRPDAGKNFYKLDLFTQQWNLYRSLNVDDSETVIVGFDQEETNLYWLDTENRDTAALVSTSLNDPSQKLTLYSPTKSDITSVMIHPTEKIPLLVKEDYMKETVVYMSETIQPDFEFIGRLVGDSENIGVIGTSQDFTRWLVRQESDVNDTSYFYYNRAMRQIFYLFSSSELRARYNYTRVTPVEVLTRDGLTEVCYVTLPLGAAPKENPLRVAKPLPMVLWVHGGPWGRDHWGFNPLYQWLANRGYAVMSCNFRASAGYGKKFLLAGNGEWGRKMQDDLTDAVNWAISRKLADPAKVAIGGGSYGGYAVLAGMTFTPDVYACGVDIVGVSNLITLLESLPPYWESGRSLMYYRIGANPNSTEGQEFLRQRSPVFFVQNVKKPLFIAQGANDPRVNQRESDQMVAGLKKFGVPVTYLLFPDEGHGFERPVNNIANYAAIESFLKQCLGGKAEPIGNDLDKSTVQIIEGSIS